MSEQSGEPASAPPAEAPATPPAETPAAPAPRRSRVPVLGFIALVLAIALSGLFWMDARQRIDATQEELAHRLRDIETASRESHAAGRQSQEALREAQSRIGQLEARLNESQGQQLALEALYQDLSRNRDEWQLAEVEQVLATASQQLQLAGNVRGALLALELAETRLARADRPQFLPVRRALARDIERLRALPTVDIGGMSLRLEALVARVDRLPLAHDERLERNAASREAAGAAQGFLERLGREIWSELRQLVVVRRMGVAEPPLLPPEQAFFLRENLKLRLLSARLSLLARDQAGYREELRVAQDWIRRYFDKNAKATAEALAQLEQLAAAEIAFEVPAISESLEAIRGFKTRSERTP